MTQRLIDESLAMKAAELRRLLLRLIATVGTGHPGSSLSCIDILTVLYYGDEYVDVERPLPERDIVVLSKGHAAPALYAILIDKNVIKLSDSDKLRAYGSQLQGHPDTRFTPGVDVSTGSSGQGLSVGLGFALGARMLGLNRRAFVLLGDDECQEGQIWESALVATGQGTSNLCAIIDYNKIQHDGPIAKIIPLEPMAEKWRAFGWRVLEVDGHDIPQLRAQLQKAVRPSGVSRPTAIIAHTIKGKGVPYMEDDWKWHSVAVAERMKQDFAMEVRDA